MLMRWTAYLNLWITITLDITLNVLVTVFVEQYPNHWQEMLVLLEKYKFNCVCLLFRHLFYDDHLNQVYTNTFVHYLQMTSECT